MAAESFQFVASGIKSVELFRLTTTDAESDAEGLDGDEQMSASDYEKLRQRYNNRIDSNHYVEDNLYAFGLKCTQS
uniref:Uncharacterized protein n=1 Tax=Rhizophagus irregularis (strain DAOM 181602 / DAOM 197198 / MUCL 43194) TaxID=747089 RepID=U9T715_RHIID